MRKKLNDLKFYLNNENGSPNVEQVIGIALSLSVGVGLFIFGKYVYDWFSGSAGETVEEIEIPDAGTYYSLD